MIQLNHLLSVLLLQFVISFSTEDSAAELLKKAKTAFDKVQYDEAITLLSKAIGLDATNPQAFYYRGLARSRKYRQEQSLADFSEAIRLDSKYAEAFRERGRVYDLTGKSDKALEDLNTALKLFPNDHRALSARGSILYELKQYKKAKDDLEAAIKIDPKEHTCYFVLATMQACCPEKEHRDGKAAVKNATKSCKLRSWYMSLDALAAAYAEDGQFEEAIKAQKKAIEAADKSGSKFLKGIYEKHLLLYEKGKPLRLRSFKSPAGDDEESGKERKGEEKMYR
jgi:tetratricopeptide (TPR) repeat protein